MQLSIFRSLVLSNFPPPPRCLSSIIPPRADVAVPLPLADLVDY